jgi:uncharacterized protein (TIGR03435 family)
MMYLSMLCMTVGTLAAGMSVALAAAHSQQPAADAGVAFEAVSIRRSVPDEPRGSWTRPGGRLDVRGQAVVSLIRQAYGIKSTQLVGGPDWIRQDLYTVQTSASGNPDSATVAAMMRRMLADRFALVTHVETRDVPTYVVTVARPGRLGPNLKPRSTPCGPGQPLPTGGTTADAPCSGGRVGGSVFIDFGITMPMFADRLAAFYLNAHVIDRTGLDGYYDISLTNIVNQWTDNPLQAEASDPNAARLPVAMEDQLGLKLELRREPMEVVVIDRIERPSEN